MIDPTSLWHRARRKGLSRRRFLQLLLAGGSAAVLAACGDDIPKLPPHAEQSLMDDQPPPVFKDATPFVNHGRSGLEARLEHLTTTITPTELFFVRNNSRSLDVDVSHWTLSVEGDAVDNPIQLTFSDLLRLPQRSLTSYLECAGNHRVMFDLLQGRPASGTQWGRGAVSNANWTGVALADVLRLAGVTNDAASVLLIGMDRGSAEGGFRRALPIERATHPDTLLAHRMNGEPLPRDHGFPLRAIVPGWIGASQIKWLSRIVVSRSPQWTRNNTTSYVLIGDDYPREGQADGQVLSVQSIKSALALPWPAQLSPGRHRLHGFAHSPSAAIARVAWSDDGGKSWHDATLGQQRDYSWVKFEFEWSASSGNHKLLTRATDTNGTTQPDQVPFNEKGYLFNQPLPHPIKVI